VEAYNVVFWRLPEGVWIWKFYSDSNSCTIPILVASFFGPQLQRRENS
jgi:prepilin signal peptidase PulO-like enzyme (type II secretory pathway)